MRAGKVIPFLGAGASRVAPPSDASSSIDQLCPPSGSELAEHLADEAEFPLQDIRDRRDLAKVSSYYVENLRRPSLKEALRRELNHDYPTGSIHQFLTEQTSIRFFVVTNYDRLLEDAFHRAGRPYDLIIYPADRKDIANSVLWWPYNAPEPQSVAPNELFIDLEKTSVIYKMHGTVSRTHAKWDNFVITEEDYVEFLSRMTANTAIPATLYDYSQECCFLFLGYSLNDWNLRVLLRNLSKRTAPKKPSDGGDEENDIPSWAIQFEPSELEKKLWDKRNVKIYNLKVEEFVRRMLDRKGT